MTTEEYEKMHAEHLAFMARVTIPGTGTLKRGRYTFPHQGQAVRRDFCAESLAKHPGGKAMAYRLTPEQVEERRVGRHPGLPYEYLVYSPDHCALSWKAFYNRSDLGDWLDAYGLKLDKEPEPGDCFNVLLPSDDSAYQPVTSE